MSEKWKTWFSMFVSFFKIGAFTIGGGYAMLPLIEQEVVNRKKWVSKNEIVDIFAISQSVPGVIAINTSLFVGYKVGGLPGACIAAAGMIFPSFFIILFIATVLNEFQSLTVVQNAFAGVRAGVAALILVTAINLTRTAIKSVAAALIAMISFMLMVFFEISPILVIILSGFSGLVFYRKK